MVIGCGGDRAGGRAEKSPGRPPRRYPAPTAEPNKAVTDYRLRGVVKKVEPELDHLTIQHEAIPGFMDAMRMRFAYKDKAVLGKLKPGDYVEGTLRVERSQGVVSRYELRGLAVTKAAPQAAPVLGPTSPGNNRLRRATTAPGSRRARPRLHHDQPGWQGRETLRSARSCRRFDVYLHAMSASRFLPVDGQEILRTGPTLERISARVPARFG